MNAARAFAWEFRRRHRWGLVAVVAYLLAAATIKSLVARSTLPLALDRSGTFALVVVVPLTGVFTWLLAVFSYGLSGDLVARPSMYPARLFALPVTTDDLARWPMLLGAATVAVLWVATRLLVPWPAGLEPSFVWPGVLAMVVLAWTQALTWMPYGLPGLRLAAATLCLVAVDTIALLAIHFRASEWVMLAILTPQLPLAYLAARGALARARRGDTPDWRGALAIPRLIGGRARIGAAARSPAGAQTWFEWRRHGWTLPTWVGILLPCELSLLWIASDAPALVAAIVIAALITPPLMAALVAAAFRAPSPDARESGAMSPFIATRPVATVALVAAKLRMALWSTLAAWLLVLAAVPAALAWSDTWAAVAGWGRQASEIVGAPRAATALLLGVVGLVASTWKQLCQSLWIGLSGRPLVMRAGAAVAVLLVCAVGPVAVWIVESPRVRWSLWESLPLVLGALVVLKVLAAAWVVPRLRASGLFADRVLVTGAMGWLAVVMALNGVLAWLFGSPHVPRYILLLVSILSVPLVRVSAAPLALAWNRHR
jgi:hypothetical protein